MFFLLSGNHQSCQPIRYTIKSYHLKTLKVGLLRYDDTYKTHGISYFEFDKWIDQSWASITNIGQMLLKITSKAMLDEEKKVNIIKFNNIISGIGIVQVRWIVA